MSQIVEAFTVLHEGKNVRALREGTSPSVAAVKVSPCQWQGLRRDNPFAFLNCDELVRFDVGHGIFVAAGPNDLHAYRLAGRRPAKTKR